MPRGKAKPKIDPQFFSDIHESGVKRHGGMWLKANQAATTACVGRLDVSKPENRELVSLIVLRVCDAVLKA